jgi:hypothetical protein
MIDALPLLLGPEGYQISRSVRLRSSASAYFNRTFTTPISNQKMTLSCWVKVGSTSQTAGQITLLNGGNGTQANASNSAIQLRSEGTGLKLQILCNGGGAATVGGYRTFAPYFRDNSAWYHIVLAADTTQATAANRYRGYINGVEITSYTGVDPNQNVNITWLNTAVGHLIGRNNETGGPVYGDTYITEMYWIDGQQLTPSSFGETNAVTGVWQPKKYAGTYGTNGFYLNFSDNSAATAAAIGKDNSGNGNNWTPNNISVTAGATYDSMLDVPTQWADGGNGRGNYATLNPLNLGSPYLSSGNLKHSTSGWSSCSGTIAISSGKWYWEVTCTTHGGSNYTVAGIVAGTRTLGAIETATLSDAYVYSNNGQKYNNNAGSAYGATWTTNDVIGVALDMDAGTLVFYKNNSSQGTAYSSLSGTYTACTGCFTGGVLDINFGQRPFAFSAPSGFKALNTLNLPAPTILKGNQYFDAKIYSGTDGVAGSVSGIGFQPDLIWGKSRSVAESHTLVDSVRGGTKGLYSDLTLAEQTNTGLITSFNSDGFSYGISSSYSNGSLVAWVWKEGPTQGFDIAAFTAPASGNFTVAHSLGVAPAMFILKSRSYADGWYVYHKNLGTPASNYLTLNATSAVASSTSIWGNTNPTSSVVTLGTGAGIAANATGILYLFSEVAGFSKFGSYTGNGAADGPFVFCGFRPRFVMWKNASASEAWLIEDTARSTFNQVALELYPSSSGAEAAGSSRSPTQQFDFLSNGFKVRGAQGQTNGSGNTIIFAAFSESPFKHSLAR